MGSPLRLALDVTQAAHALGGVRRYLLGMAEGLGQLASEGRLEMTCIDVPAARPGTEPPLKGAMILPTPACLGIPLVRRMAVRKGWEVADRPRRLARIVGCDLYHCSGAQPCFPPGSRPVVTLFDTGALEHPEWHTPETVRFWEAEAGLIARGAGVLAISGWAAQRATALLGTISAPVGVAGGAASRVFQPGAADPQVLQMMGLEPDAFFLHVGNYVPHKNIPMLIGAFEAAGMASRGFPLVLAGAGGWKRPPMRGEGVRVLEAVSDEQLLHLYRGARALLLPSVYEGLGLPVLEALACRCAVVAADSTALPETLGGHGLLVPPDDRARWAEAISSLGEDAFMDDMRSLAAGAPVRTWRDAATDALRYYLELVDL